MTRILLAPSPSGVTLAGTLGQALVGHTRERMRHFFLFLYLYRMLMLLLDLPPGAWAGYVSAKATHQVDTGLRRDEDWDVVFDKTAESVLDLPASAFRRVDAAHYCNLGLRPGLADRCALSTDPRVHEIYAVLLAVCGNTRLLPQRVNIGPDRVVDIAHAVLCHRFLGQMAAGKAPISPPFFATYKRHVTAALRAYAQEHAARGNDGVVAATGVYLATLTEDTAPTELRQQGATRRVIRVRDTHSEEIWTTLVGNATADYVAHGLARDPGVDLSVFVSRSVA